MGVVIEVNGDKIATVEGNTNMGGSRKGFGVFKRTRKLEMASLLGYLDFWHESRLDNSFVSPENRRTRPMQFKSAHYYNKRQEEQQP